MARLHKKLTLAVVICFHILSLKKVLDNPILMGKLETPQLFLHSYSLSKIKMR